MLSTCEAPRVYLATGATDMRKSIDGLAAIVSQSFELDPFDASLFVFCNKGREAQNTLLGAQRILALLPQAGAGPFPLAGFVFRRANGDHPPAACLAARRSHARAAPGPSGGHGAHRGLSRLAIPAIILFVLIAIQCIGVP